MAHPLFWCVIRAKRTTLRALSRLQRWLEKNAPPTDKECDWSWPTLHCEPRDVCTFKFQVLNLLWPRHVR